MTIEEQVFVIHMKDYWTEEDRKFLDAHRDINIYPTKLDAKTIEELNRKADEKYYAKLKDKKKEEKDSKSIVPECAPKAWPDAV